MARPCGALRRALVPTPSTVPAAPPPTRVVTLREDVPTTRSALLPVSATNRDSPSGDSASARGEKNDAAVPPPLVNKGFPEPARVITTREATTTERTALFAESATNSTPAASLSARPRGAEKHAAVPVPSMSAGVDDGQPARVVTAPAGLTVRIAWRPMSATNAVPDVGDTARPAGAEKRAAAPVASTVSSTPFPARVVTAPTAATRRTRLPSVSATSTSPTKGPPPQAPHPAAR
jgi:hypothetical protein